MKKNKPLIQLTDEQRRALRAEIHDCFLNEWDEEIGLIRQDRILELFMETLGPMVYNAALDDAKAWHERLMDSAEADYYQLYRP